MPSFRIGVHGGEVVVSEQGDTKRAIGVYGSTINIAARMEEAAKVHDLSCVISGDVAEALCERNGRLLPIGHEKVRGISAELPIFEYRRESRCKTPATSSMVVCTQLPLPRPHLQTSNENLSCANSQLRIANC